MINQNANNQPIHADEPPESVKAHTGDREQRPSSERATTTTRRQNVSTLDQAVEPARVSVEGWIALYGAVRDVRGAL